MGNRRHVLFLCSTYPPHTGGAERYAQLIAEGVAQRGHDVTVVTDGLRAAADGREALSGTQSRVLRLRSYDERLDRIDRVHWEEMQFAVLHELRGVGDLGNPDIVHSNSLDAAILGAHVARDLGIPHVATFHEQAPERDAFGVGKCKVVYGSPLFDAVIAGSRFYEARAKRFTVDHEKIHLIYHGIDTDIFSPRTPATDLRPLGVSPGDVVILASGRLSPRKGFLELVHAMAMVRRQAPHARAIIAGGLTSASEEYASKLRSTIAQMGLTDTVLLMGEQASSAMAGLVSASDIVTQPSHAEGLGLAAIEGMSCGKPVVATRVTGLDEIVVDGENGVCCEPQNAEDLARALLSVIADPQLRQRLGARGRALAVECYGIDRMIADTLKLYQSLIGSRGA